MRRDIVKYTCFIVKDIKVAFSYQTRILLDEINVIQTL